MRDDSPAPQRLQLQSSELARRLSVKTPQIRIVTRSSQRLRTPNILSRSLHERTPRPYLPSPHELRVILPDMGRPRITSPSTMSGTPLSLRVAGPSSNGGTTKPIRSARSYDPPMGIVRLKSPACIQSVGCPSSFTPRSRDRDKKRSSSPSRRRNSNEDGIAESELVERNAAVGVSPGSSSEETLTISTPSPPHSLDGSCESWGYDPTSTITQVTFHDALESIPTPPLSVISPHLPEERTPMLQRSSPPGPDETLAQPHDERSSITCGS